ncbi:hypothetical protein A2973_01185 [Candidatus Gottesmanbacteria bacterium RIFCSPLOWO2_01_FULL_49_10]|uniref:Uncharacterized protein n=1 Tax=Candidatus Gottesmanbacteria bacterium RIFCSPLOWO2_01_FULL_49_10 TaxID=1798396 RepID=A0A1F6B104_9BACT|nr:MAG: hypothetical protein A2973_01185 [Candidatus Gottesmanbacteria bacterium RIFCSPLOWO2_01_FULL_49_10]
MPSQPEVSRAIASLDSLSDEELHALAKRFIANYDLTRAERRAQFTLTPAAVEQYLEEPRSGIEMNDPLVARALAEALFRKYLKRSQATQPPDHPLTTLGAPEG